jgi:hypothetical protein
VRALVFPDIRIIYFKNISLKVVYYHRDRKINQQNRKKPTRVPHLCGILVYDRGSMTDHYNKFPYRKHATPYFTCFKLQERTISFESFKTHVIGNTITISINTEYPYDLSI